MARWSVLLLVLALLAGCAGSAPASRVPSTPAVPATRVPSIPAVPATTLSVPSPTARSSPEGPPPPARIDEGDGANAAPQDPGGSTAAYDSTQGAANLFGAWWRYEVQVDSDAKRDIQSVYTNGIFVCTALSTGNGTQAILTALTRDFGYTGSGAESVIAAALRGLCTPYNLGQAYDDRIEGYKTYFDGNVELAYTRYLQQVTYTGPPPNLYTIGWLAKNACAYLSAHGTAEGMSASLLSGADNMTWWLTETEHIFHIAVSTAVLADCPALDGMLGPFWSQ